MKRQERLGNRNWDVEMGEEGERLG